MVCNKPFRLSLLGLIPMGGFFLRWVLHCGRSCGSPIGELGVMFSSPCSLVLLEEVVLDGEVSLVGCMMVCEEDTCLMSVQCRSRTK